MLQSKLYCLCVSVVINMAVDRMTEEDIMWQLQQMEEEGEEEDEDEYDAEYQLQQQQEQEKQEEPPKVVVEEKKSEEECISNFNELLQERNISPFAMYSTEYPQLMNDPRFSRKITYN